MGSLVVPVKDLLSQPQLVLDEWLPLDGALPESEILLRAELKVGENHHFSITSVSVPCRSHNCKQNNPNMFRVVYSKIIPKLVAEY